MEKAAAGPGARADAHVGFVIAARYAVGVHHTFSSLQPAGAASQAAQLLPQVDGEATDLEGNFASGQEEGPTIPADHGDYARGERHVDPS